MQLAQLTRSCLETPLGKLHPKTGGGNKYISESFDYKRDPNMDPKIRLIALAALKREPECESAFESTVANKHCA